MALSLPSKKIVVCDAPEIENFSAKFVYNFFTVDENTNDSGTTPPDFIENKPSAGFDASFLNSINFNRFTPRYIKLEWRPVPKGNRPDLGTKVSIEKNKNKIHDEQTFITSDYTNIFFQDNERDNKIAYFIRRAIDEARQSMDPNPKDKIESPLDVTKFLNKNTSNNITGDFLINGFAGLKKNGIRFVGEKNENQVTQTLLQTVKNVRTRTQLNNKFISTLLKTVSKNPINIFDDEIEKKLTSAQRIQEKAIAQEHSSVMSGHEYDFQILDIVDYKVVDPNSFDSTIQVVGYVIDKCEFTHGGTVPMDSIIVESPTAGTTADLKIRYSGIYGYSIRSIVLAEITCEDEETNAVMAVSFLISSRSSPQVVVDCRETVSPPPVADFNVQWDHFQNAPRLSWSFPPNPQRDIKYFQIFKRGNINEPFQLIKMYDFNDSLTPTALPEYPDNVLIEKMSSPKAFYLDPAFTKESKAIYTICTLDAHGFTSNYSIQFECSFDKFKNKLVKKLISLAGAPKAYPNFILQNDTFVDSIRTSGAKGLRIIFNPEYLNVVDNLGNDLKLLKMDGNSAYKLQMINVDLQEQQTISINLLDKRLSSKKTS